MGQVSQLEPSVDSIISYLGYLSALTNCISLDDCMDPWEAGIRDPADIGAALREFFLDTVIASVDMINPVDHGLFAGHEPRKDQAGGGS